MNPTSTFLATDGDGYELNMGRWSRLLATPFLKFAQIGSAAKVLDVGCGTGNLSAALAQTGTAQSVLGIDVSPVYIDYATVRNRDKRISFRLGDACALDCPAESFDSVLSMLTLHFVPQPQHAIAEMRRVAKRGAVIAATVWDARGGFVANRLFFDTAAALDAKAAERRAKNYTRPLTHPGELADAWKDAGLVDVTEEQLVIRMDYASFADYWAPYLGNDGPGAEYVRTLDDKQKERLRAAVQSAYLDGEVDGPRSYAALAWAVRGLAP